MNFQNVRLFLSDEMSDIKEDIICDLEIFFKNQSKDIYFDFFIEDLNKCNELLIIICYPNLNFVANSIKNKLKDFLKRNKLLLIDNFDSERKWTDFIDDHPDVPLTNIHRVSDNITSNTDVLMICPFIKLYDVKSYIYNWHNRKSNLKSFFCLMNNKRPHRDLLVEKLYEKNLLQSGKIVYHKCENENINTLLTRQEKFSDLKNFEGTHLDHMWFDNRIGPDYLEYNLEIVAETVCDFPHVTEKTVRPLFAGMPFTVVSSPFYLKYLKSFGFETYHKFFDESYDNEPELEKRIDLMTDVIKDITNSNLLTLFNDTKEIREHNLETLYKLKISYTSLLSEKIYSFIKNL